MTTTTYTDRRARLLWPAFKGRLALRIAAILDGYVFAGKGERSDDKGAIQATEALYCASSLLAEVHNANTVGDILDSVDVAEQRARDFLDDGRGWQAEVHEAVADCYREAAEYLAAP